MHKANEIIVVAYVGSYCILPLLITLHEWFPNYCSFSLILQTTTTFISTTTFTSPSRSFTIYNLLPDLPNPSDPISQANP